MATPLFATREEHEALRRAVADMKADESGRRLIVDRAERVTARAAMAERAANAAAERADGAIDDVRMFAERVRKIEATVTHPDHGNEAIAGKLSKMGETLDRFADALSMGTERDAELGKRVDIVGRKASGAKHMAIAADARASKTEEQIKAALAEASRDREALKVALDAAAAKSKAIVANPPQGAELADLRREVLGTVRSHVPTIVRASVLVFVAACVAAASQFYACSPGGL